MYWKKRDSGKQPQYVSKPSLLLTMFLQVELVLSTKKEFIEFEFKNCYSCATFHNSLTIFGQKFGIVKQVRNDNTFISFM